MIIVDILEIVIIIGFFVVSIIGLISISLLEKTDEEYNKLIDEYNELQNENKKLNIQKDILIESYHNVLMGSIKG